MSTEIRNIEPQSLWGKFADLNAVPRASKKEERVIAFIKNFGESLGLDTRVDSVGNVIIRKPATSGMENRKVIVMQSHLDMVHQKNNDTVFDFDTQGIDMIIDGDWVRAKGTTLGADNGIGVATIMAILAATDIVHPAIEALFTIDEEAGMTGVKGLKGGLLQGEILLNLDTENDEEIDIGCAGGIDVTASRSYQMEAIDKNKYTGIVISIKGLNGGHSGMDIHKSLGNANKLLVRLLVDAYDRFGMRVSEMSGGSLRNAIPRESGAIIMIPLDKKEAFIHQLNTRVADIKKEFQTMEPNLIIQISDVGSTHDVIEVDTQEKLLKAIYTAHNGVYRMSPNIKDLVETSNNVAIVDIKNGEARILCLSRSSVDSAKYDVAATLKAAFELAGCAVTFSGDYPGWTPNVDSPILKVLSDVYENLYKSKPSIVACHAGLECGIISQNYPDMDMISFGPTIHGAHSPDERASISSVRKYWNFVLEILKNIPEKSN